MPKILTTDIFKNKAVDLHGFTYCYNKINYINTKSKVIITCKEHGDFEQRPNDHLQGKGCPVCNKKEKLTTEQFINKAKQVHSDKYDYSLVEYKHSKSKIVIICPIHGKFIQRANNHLQNNGCPNCAVDEHERTGWKLKDWIQAAENSKNFDSFKVYIIKCQGNGEKFYKIGRTFTTLKQRFSADFYLPYNWSVIKLFEGSADDMFCLEKQLQEKNSDFKYCPNKKFSGVRECFKNISYGS